MKHLASILAIASLLVAVPVYAGDASSDRHFTAGRGGRSRLVSGDPRPAASPEVKKESPAPGCSCAKSGERAEAAR